MSSSHITTLFRQLKELITKPNDPALIKAIRDTISKLQQEMNEILAGPEQTLTTRIKEIFPYTERAEPIDFGKNLPWDLTPEHIALLREIAQTMQSLQQIEQALASYGIMKGPLYDNRIRRFKNNVIIRQRHLIQANIDSATSQYLFHSHDRHKKEFTLIVELFGLLNALTSNPKQPEAYWQHTINLVEMLTQQFTQLATITNRDTFSQAFSLLLAHANQLQPISIAPIFAAAPTELQQHLSHALAQLEQESKRARSNAAELNFHYNTATFKSISRIPKLLQKTVVKKTRSEPASAQSKLHQLNQNLDNWVQSNETKPHSDFQYFTPLTDAHMKKIPQSDILATLLRLQSLRLTRCKLPNTLQNAEKQLSTAYQPLQLPAKQVKELLRQVEALGYPITKSTQIYHRAIAPLSQGLARFHQGHRHFPQPTFERLHTAATDLNRYLDEHYPAGSAQNIITALYKQLQRATTITPLQPAQQETFVLPVTDSTKPRLYHTLRLMQIRLKLLEKEAGAKTDPKTSTITQYAELIALTEQPWLRRGRHASSPPLSKLERDVLSTQLSPIYGKERVREVLSTQLSKPQYALITRDERSKERI